MIITQLNGGLGNQMFQYAVARRLAYELNTDFKIDRLIYERYPVAATPREYELNKFTVQENFASQEDVDAVIIRNKMESRDVGREKGELTFHKDVLTYGDNVYFQGYWQCERYFADIADLIRKDFSLRKPLGINAKKWEQKIRQSARAVSLHIRRGDYISNVSANEFHGVCSLNYYYRCIEKMQSQCGDIVLYVFSDDLLWAKKNLMVQCPVHWVEGVDTDAEEMYLMSRCSHHIIANSSFSWWGAWLNPSEKKCVFAPARWFQKEAAIDIIPDNWIRV